MKIRCLVFTVSMIWQSGVLACTEGDDSYVCKQSKMLDAIVVDLNKSTAALSDDFLQQPAKAIEAGCLDQLSMLNINSIFPDVASVIGVIYSDLKDRLLNMGCNFIEDKYNEQMEKLTLRLKTPYGLGSVNVGPGRNVRDTNDLIGADVTLSNTELREAAVTEVFGSPSSFSDKQFTQKELNKSLGTDEYQERARKEKDAKTLKDKILDVKGLFKSSDIKEKGNE